MNIQDLRNCIGKVTLIAREFIRAFNQRKDQSMDLTALLAAIASLQVSLDAVKAQADAFPQQLEDAKKAAYDQGFADGKASVTPPTDPEEKIYSQKQLDDAVAAKAAEMQGQLDTLSAQMAQVQADLDQAKIDLKHLQDEMAAQVQSAVEGERARCLALVKAQKASEDQSEGDLEAQIASPQP